METMINPADKRISWSEALSMLPEEDYSIGFGGVTLYRRPMAFSIQLAHHLRGLKKIPSIELFCFTASIESDLLVGAGVVHSVRSCYFGLEVFGFAPHFTNAANKGEIKIIEESEASFAYGIRARLADVGFMPSPAWQGTDLFKVRPDVKSIEDPYSGELLTAFPALDCDVAVIHAIEADHRGNAQIGANQGIDRDLSFIAKQVFITAEKIVPALDRADIFGQNVTGVIEASKGAWPTSCHPLYPLDGEAILHFSESTEKENFEELLSSWLDKHNAFN
jgi:glutaconate CoA-transferase subunit A